ncbi:MAG: cytochrome C [Deltaproteobacteria bacterium]|nr:cytochrome C [Deltaproteobacteria bacterium]
MGILKRKKSSIELFSSPKAMRLIVALSSIFMAATLFFVFGCEQKAGILPSQAASEQKAAAVATVTGPELTDAQCVLCHPKQPQTIDASGGKHKTEVGCMDCHQEHPPQGEQAIPQCSMCHSGEPHYELEQCSSCHTDTHAPLDLTIEGDITGPCLTCHQQQGDELAKHPSAHTDLACNECHATVHKKIPDCMECHQKHTEEMDFAACVSCHQVHQPLLVTYSENTPSSYCGACHEEAVSLLEANTTKHHDLACVYCHKNEHKTVPPCFACHGKPHPDSMLKKFPECGDCHGTAHDLKG